ncbi:unnamed protein product, partial [Sphacelaria rigidula]
RTSNLSSSDGDSSRRKRGSSARARDYVTASPASQAPTAAETDCPIAAAATSARKALSAQQELVTVAHENAADGEAGEHERLSQRSNLPPITQQDSEVAMPSSLQHPSVAEASALGKDRVAQARPAESGPLGTPSTSDSADR